MTLLNVRAGFKITGVHPLNRQAAVKRFEPPSDTTKRICVGFLPMLSPTPRKRNVPTRHESAEPEIQEARYNYH